METEVKTNEETLISKGYEFLRQLCAFNADYSAFDRRPVWLTNRVEYINAQLNKHGIKYENDSYNPDNITGISEISDNVIIKDGYAVCFVNVVVKFEGENTNETTVFLAHHDVNNKASENCQDNTASVANLLDLCVRLSKRKPANNVVVVFTDAEEIVRPDICGSKRLANNIKDGKYGNVKYSVNLELTAHGRNYWMSYGQENVLSKVLREKMPSIARVHTPYNDAMVLEMNGLPSVCIGSLDDDNIRMAKGGRGCPTWFLCHRLEDTFDTQANEADMDAFVGFLETLI